MQKKKKSFWQLTYEVRLQTWPIFLVTVILIAYAFFAYGANMYTINGSIVLIALSFWTIKAGFEVVPENWVFMFSILGDFQDEWKEGLHWRFPWLGITRIDAEVYLGTQSVSLLVETEKEEDGYIDFKDQSAPVKIDFYFQIIDPYLAVYGVTDVIRMISEHAYSAVRSLLAMYTVNEANELKSAFDLNAIATSTMVQRDASGKVIDPGITNAQMKQSIFYKTLISWGVEPTLFIIEDIRMTPKIIEQREKIMEASIDLKVAEIKVKTAEKEVDAQLVQALGDRKQTVELMTGQAEGTERLALALAKQIDALVQKGMKPNEAALYVLQLAKAEAMKNAEKATWIENSNSAANGASFGAGFNS